MISSYESHTCRDCEIVFKRRFISENAYREMWYLDSNGQKTKGNKCHDCYVRTQNGASHLARKKRQARKRAKNSGKQYLIDPTINAHCKPCKICSSMTANYYACDTCWKNNRGSVNTQDVPNFTKEEMALVYAPLDKGIMK